MREGPAFALWRFPACPACLSSREGFRRYSGHVNGVLMGSCAEAGKTATGNFGQR